MKTPLFWDKKSSWISYLLAPLGKCYAWSVARRFKRVKPYQAPVPVICVGNISVGGTGKTPVCLALMKILKDKGWVFLNHGYKSHLKNISVDTNTHSAFDVGDEAMLLAQVAPTIVDNHRARGAQTAVKKGAKGIIMDDGFQNPSLIKTLSFVVVDGKKLDKLVADKIHYLNDKSTANIAFIGVGLNIYAVKLGLVFNFVKA